VRELNLTDVTQVAVGGIHTVALRSDGSAWTWGYNGFGELGRGDTTNRAVPSLVVSLGVVTSVAAGSVYTLAIAGGDVYAWGNNAEGELGDSTTTERHLPTRVLGLPPAGSPGAVTTVAAGTRHSFALTANHRLEAWGGNGGGELGDGTTTDRLLPVQVPGVTTAEQVDGGNAFTLAVVS
jgi:alpha-tubulin suppressor-like RCC1 family protein